MMKLRQSKHYSKILSSEPHKRPNLKKTPRKKTLTRNFVNLIQPIRDKLRQSKHYSKILSSEPHKRPNLKKTPRKKALTRNFVNLIQPIRDNFNFFLQRLQAECCTRQRSLLARVGILCTRLTSSPCRNFSNFFLRRQDQ